MNNVLTRATKQKSFKFSTTRFIRYNILIRPIQYEPRSSLDPYQSQQAYMIQPLIRSNFDFAQLEQKVMVAVDAALEAIDSDEVQLDWEIPPGDWQPQCLNSWMQQKLPQF